MLITAWAVPGINARYSVKNKNQKGTLSANSDAYEFRGSLNVTAVYAPNMNAPPMPKKPPNHAAATVCLIGNFLIEMCRLQSPTYGPYELIVPAQASMPRIQVG